VTIERLLLLIAIGLPLAGCVVLPGMGRRLGRRTGWVALAFPVVSTVALLVLAGTVPLPGRTVVEWVWVPSLGVNCSWLVDGLSLFFALVVSGMGVLVVFYAIFYLDDAFAHHGRFYGYLVFFMATMLGTVLSNNLVLLFVFWELTGLASFLLIGFLHGEGESRVGARQALLVTSGTGLAMLAGVVMVFTATGTYDLAELLGGPLPWEAQGGWLSAALVLILAGALGKSAQFPFFFWLPNAMAAPTPVSAYLHSATMVKLGVFLTARVFPLFVGSEVWLPLLTLIAFTTMTLGAFLAFVSHDLKAILACSTVSQLGYLIGYYGMGPVGGVEYDYLHILNHVFYKGGLFMVAGIVAHAAGLRDLRQLGGLLRRLPLVGVTCFIGAATMAGLPGTTGFLSKEAMLKEIFEAMVAHDALGWYATACVVVTSVLKVAFSIRFFAKLFLGPERPEVMAHFHAPPLALQLPPAILAVAALLLGLWPGLLEEPFRLLAVAGLNRPPVELTIWHGLTLELAVSMAVVALGLGLYVGGERTGWRWHAVPRWLKFDRAFEGGVERLSVVAKGVTRRLRSDEPLDYLPLVLGFGLVTVGGGAVWQGLAWLEEREGVWPVVARPDLLRSLVAGLICLAVVGVVALRRWTTQLIALSVAGFLTCFYYVLYRAPDLALTQILVETATLILILLLLGRFPRSAELGEVRERHPPWRKALNVLVAGGMGVLMTGLALMGMAEPHAERVGERVLEATVPWAEGRNAVNTVLVDFRGFDTLGEITVLLVAALGCLGLLMRRKRTPEEYRAGPKGPPGLGIEDPEGGDHA
jgi:NADH:ubiquinone oxidoreductase subunit 5 (subunit L)/multisubunit Na+/H+ antiporter MnhA subunit/multisubunit Na+/H+ antiporter MnhB subunit